MDTPNSSAVARWVNPPKRVSSAAAIGLIEDNVAVVVGAMVIAPLLGPNIALAFGTSIGDGRLAWQALKCGIAGLGLAFLLAAGIGRATESTWNGMERRLIPTSLPGPEGANRAVEPKEWGDVAWHDAAPR